MAEAATTEWLGSGFYHQFPLPCRAAKVAYQIGAHVPMVSTSPDTR